MKNKRERESLWQVWSSLVVPESQLQGMRGLAKAWIQVDKLGRLKGGSKQSAVRTRQACIKPGRKWVLLIV